MGVIVGVSVRPTICRVVVMDDSKHYPSFRIPTIKDSYAAFCDRALNTVRQVLKRESRGNTPDAIGIAVYGEVVDDMVRATCCLQHLDGEPLAEDFRIEFSEAPTIMIGQTEATALGKMQDSWVTVLRDDLMLAGALVAAQQLLLTK